MAAVADEEGEVRDLSTEQLRDAAGIADRTYRRARTALLASGSVELVNGVGGRGNTNVWTVRDPRETGDAVSSRVPRRVAPPAGARPLIASAVSPGAAAQVHERAAQAVGKGGQDRTLTAGNSPILTGVSEPKGGHDRTVPRREVSCRDRGFGRKGRSGSDTFRARADRKPGANPGENPGRNPGSPTRAREGNP